MRVVALILAASLTLAGCGLQGDLYLPPPKPKPAASQPPAEDAADEDPKPDEAVPPP